MDQKCVKISGKSRSVRHERFRWENKISDLQSFDGLQEYSTTRGNVDFDEVELDDEQRVVRQKNQLFLVQVPVINSENKYRIDIITIYTIYYNIL